MTSTISPGRIVQLCPLDVIDVDRGFYAYPTEEGLNGLEIPKPFLTVAVLENVESDTWGILTPLTSSPRPDRIELPKRCLSGTSKRMRLGDVYLQDAAKVLIAPLTTLGKIDQTDFSYGIPVATEEAVAIALEAIKTNDRRQSFSGWFGGILLFHDHFLS